MMALTFSIAAVFLTIGVVMAAALIWQAWPDPSLRRSLVVLIGVVALWAMLYGLVWHIAGGWQPGIGLAALAPIVPVVALLIGWRINAHDERGREERQRIRTQEEQSVESRRETLSDFQISFASYHYGLLHSVAARLLPDAAKVLGIIWSVDQDWNQNYMNANIRVDALLARIDDKELRKRVEYYSDVGLIDKSYVNDIEKYNSLSSRLKQAFEAVNQRAGELYRELGAPTPPPPEPPWWRRIW